VRWAAITPLLHHREGGGLILQWESGLAEKDIAGHAGEEDDHLVTNEE